MEPMRDLPAGFGMALLQNQSAMRNFEGMDGTQRQSLIDQTHAIQSKAEMRAFVSSMGEHFGVE